MPVTASIGVTPGNAAELVTALIMVAAVEKSSISAAFSANVFSGDSLGQMDALMQVAARFAVALIHVVPGVAALMIAAAIAATLK